MASSLDEILRGIGANRVPNSGLSVSALSQANRANRQQQQQGQPLGFSEWLAQKESGQLQQQPGGWAAVGGKVLGALNVLDMPRRAIVSGLKEGLDAVGITDGDASWGDFKSQFDDPTFGFGTITGDLTGNKWIDRAIGFTGDVLLDPLTYVTGGANAGLKKGMSSAGRQGRFGLATRGALQGADDAAVSAMSRLGGAAVSDAATRAELGLADRGLRFMGKRIAGTGGIDRAIGNTLAKGRNSVTSSDWWTNISRKPEGLENVYKTLQQGSGSMRPTEAATVLAYVNSRKAGKNEFFKSYEGAARGVVGKMSESERIALTHATEAGNDTALGGLLTRIREDLVSRDAQIGELPNYVPHTWTREAWDWLKGDSAGAVEFRKVAKVDLTEGPSMSMSRVFKEGTYTFNGTKVDFGAGTITDINGALRRAFGDGPAKFLEDDAGKLLSKYLDDAASAAGVVGAAKRLQESSLDTVRLDAFDFIPDEDLNKIANKELADMFKARKKETRQRQDALLKETADAAKSVRLSLADDIAVFAQRQDDVGAKIQGMMDDWAKDQSPRLQLARFQKTVGELRDGWERQANEALAEITRLETRASQLRSQAGGFGANGASPERVAQELQKIAERTAKEKARLEVIRADQQMLPRLLTEQDRLQREVADLTEIVANPQIAAEAYAAANPQRAKPQVFDTEELFTPLNGYSLRSTRLQTEVDAMEEALLNPVVSAGGPNAAAQEITDQMDRVGQSLMMVESVNAEAFADLVSSLGELGIERGIVSRLADGKVLESQVLDMLGRWFEKNPFMLPDEVLGRRNHVISKLGQSTRQRNRAAGALDDARRLADENVQAFLDTPIEGDVLGRTVRDMFDEEHAKRLAALESDPIRMTDELVRVQSKIDEIEREIARLDSLAGQPSVAASEVPYPIRRTKEASDRLYQQRLDARPKNRDIAEWHAYYQKTVDDLTDRSIAMMEDAQDLIEAVGRNKTVDVERIIYENFKKNNNLSNLKARLDSRKTGDTAAREALATANTQVRELRDELNNVYRFLPDHIKQKIDAVAASNAERRKAQQALELLERQLDRVEELGKGYVDIKIRGTSVRQTVSEAKRTVSGLKAQIDYLDDAARLNAPQARYRTTAEYMRWNARKAAVARAHKGAAGNSTRDLKAIALDAGGAVDPNAPRVTASPLDFSAERNAQLNQAVRIAAGTPTDYHVATLPELYREMQAVDVLNNELFGRVNVTGLDDKARKAADTANGQAEVLRNTIDKMPFEQSQISSVDQFLKNRLVTDGMLALMPEDVAAKWAQMQSRVSSRILRGRQVGTDGAQAFAQTGLKGATPQALPAEQAVRNLEARIQTLRVIRERRVQQAKQHIADYKIDDPRSVRAPEWDDWFAGEAERIADIDTLIGGAEKTARGLLHDMHDDAVRLAKDNQVINTRLPNVQPIEELVEASIIGAAIARVHAAASEGLLPLNAAGQIEESAFDAAFQRALTQSARDSRKYYKGLAEADAAKLIDAENLAGGAKIGEKAEKEIRLGIDNQLHDVASRVQDAMRRNDKHRAIFKKIEAKAPKGDGVPQSGVKRSLVVEKADGTDQIIVGVSAPTLDDYGRTVVFDEQGKKWIIGEKEASDSFGVEEVTTSAGKDTTDWMSGAKSDDALKTKNVEEFVDNGGNAIEWVDDSWLRKVGYKEIREELAATVDTAAAEIKTILGASITWDQARKMASGFTRTRSSFGETAKLWERFLTSDAISQSARVFQQRAMRNRSRQQFAEKVIQATSGQTPDGTILSWRNAIGLDSVDPISRYQVAASRREGLRQFVRDAATQAEESRRALDELNPRIAAAQSGEADRLATRVQIAENDPYTVLPDSKNPDALRRKADAVEQGVDPQVERYVTATDALKQVDRVEAEGLAQFDRAADARKAANKYWDGKKGERQAVAKELRKKAENVKKAPKKFGSPQAARDFNDLVNGLGREVQKNGLNNWSVRTYGLLDQYEGALQQVKNAEHDLLFFDSMIKSAEQQQLAAPVFKRVYRDGFEQLGPELLGDAGPQVTSAVSAALKNFETAIDNGEFFKYLEYANRFFKTYATLTPGFHVRNLVSAGFMNFSDNVGLRDHAEAFQIWANIRRGGKDAIEALTPDQRLALQATFGSGVAGRFGVEEVGARAGASVIEQKALDNWAIRLSRSLGENYVEGPIRLAAGLAAVKGGGNLDQAIAKISRLHFDYSELSKFDRYAKQLVPFYVFASRNAPLQIQQMLTKPKAYAVYRNFVNNFAQDEENEIMPQWIRERMGFVAGRDVGMFGGNDIALTPDLPFVNLAEDISKFNPMDPKRALTDLTPFLKVPLETMVFDKNLFFDSPFYGGTPEKISYAARSVAPPLAQAQRLLGLGDRYSGREAQSWANYLGIPVRELSPQVIESEMRRRAREG